MQSLVKLDVIKEKILKFDSVITLMSEKEKKLKCMDADYRKLFNNYNAELTKHKQLLQEISEYKKNYQEQSCKFLKLKNKFDELQETSTKWQNRIALFEKNGLKLEDARREVNIVRASSNIKIAELELTLKEKNEEITTLRKQFDDYKLNNDSTIQQALDDAKILYEEKIAELELVNKETAAEVPLVVNNDSCQVVKPVDEASDERMSLIFNEMIIDTQPLSPLPDIKVVTNVETNTVGMQTDASRRNQIPKTMPMTGSIGIQTESYSSEAELRNVKITNAIGVQTDTVTIKPMLKVTESIGLQTDTVTIKPILKVTESIGLQTDTVTIKPILKVTESIGLQTDTVTIKPILKVTDSIGLQTDLNDRTEVDLKNVIIRNNIGIQTDTTKLCDRQIQVSISESDTCTNILPDDRMNRKLTIKKAMLVLKQAKTTVNLQSGRIVKNSAKKSSVFRLLEKLMDYVNKTRIDTVSTVLDIIGHDNHKLIKNANLLKMRVRKKRLKKLLPSDTDSSSTVDNYEKPKVPLFLRADIESTDSGCVLSEDDKLERQHDMVLQILHEEKSVPIVTNFAEDSTMDSNDSSDLLSEASSKVSPRRNVNTDFHIVTRSKTKRAGQTSDFSSFTEEEADCETVTKNVLKHKLTNCEGDEVLEKKKCTTKVTRASRLSNLRKAVKKSSQSNIVNVNINTISEIESGVVTKRRTAHQKKVLSPELKSSTVNTSIVNVFESNMNDACVSDYSDSVSKKSATFKRPLSFRKVTRTASADLSILADIPVVPSRTNVELVQTQMTTVPKQIDVQLDPLEETRAIGEALEPEIVGSPGKVPTWDVIKNVFIRLSQFKDNHEILEKVVNLLKQLDDVTIVRFMLRHVIDDRSEPGTVSCPFEPRMTDISKVFLGIILQFEDSTYPSLTELFLETCETQLLFYIKQPEQIRRIITMYAGVCKMKGGRQRLRKLLCDGMYFMGDLAAPLIYHILVTWLSILPVKAKGVQEDTFVDQPLIKILIQVVHTKSNKVPEYYVCTLRNLLDQYYHYPKERYNENDLIKEFLEKYICTKREDFETAILILCKNNTQKWVLKNIDLIRELILVVKQEEIVKNLIHLILKIKLQFKKNIGSLKKIDALLENITTDLPQYDVKEMLNIASVSKA